MARTPFGTMKICSRQGKSELMGFNHSARSGSRHNRDIFSIFLLKYEYMLCVLIRIAYTQYTSFNLKKKITLNYLKSSVIGFSKGLMKEFETAMENESSVSEPLKFYCT